MRASCVHVLVHRLESGTLVVMRVCGLAAAMYPYLRRAASRRRGRGRGGTVFGDVGPSHGLSARAAPWEADYLSR